MSRADDTILDEIIYARVLITLQKVQLERQDRRLRDRLADVLEDEEDVAARCRGSLQRAWERAADELELDEEQRRQMMAA